MPMNIKPPTRTTTETKRFIPIPILSLLVDRTFGGVLKSRLPDV
jgi:hypothetical protein